jgi:hypothetical protein
MLVPLQLVAVAFVPLKLTVLVPCVPPKLLPAIVTEVPTAPEVGFRLVIFGTELLALFTVIITPVLVPILFEVSTATARSVCDPLEFFVVSHETA